MSKFERRTRVCFSVSVMPCWARINTWSEEIFSASELAQSLSVTSQFQGYWSWQCFFDLSLLHFLKQRGQGGVLSWHTAEYASWDWILFTLNVLKLHQLLPERLVMFVTLEVFSAVLKYYSDAERKRQWGGNVFWFKYVWGPFWSDITSVLFSYMWLFMLQLKAWKG